MPFPLSASLDHGQAVLRFPYDDRLRVLLRAIPGRRWDPAERAWLVPLDEDRAEALHRLFASLPAEPRLSSGLARAIERNRRRRRRRARCLLDLARPDERWWLTLPSDAPGELLQELTQHPHAYTLPAIGRVLLPLDEETRRLLDDLPPAALALMSLSEDAHHALTELRRNLQPEPRALAARHNRLAAREQAERERAAREQAERERIARERAELRRFLAGESHWLSPGALAYVHERREHDPRSQELVALSAARHASLEIPGLAGELKPFQCAGVSYLLAQRRAFLADEQGLGKTIEALAALQADHAFPAVVVCPASLKLNWLREIQRWLPARTAHALTGAARACAAAARASAAAAQASAAAAPGELPQPPDITVVNYDILASRLPELEALAPRALVLDESHYCKNPSAKRTQAVARLADAVPREGLVLALTGTPVMNRPPELISQLRIIGRLADFGSGAEFGRRFRGPDAHLRLHWHLRARCFVRRLKADVLSQLPPKTRSVLPIELDNRHEYRLAERDLVAWLRTQPMDLRELDAKVAAALRAERLVRLNALKLLAARGKLHAALAWIHDFCASGEPLVVFARHREIQRAVLQRFPHALHILGGDTHRARDASLRAFQQPHPGSEQSTGPLIVCSLEVAGQGLTLTRASNVAFLELDWTPAKHDQAEDRCHRIGQRDAVTAHYLLAAGTVDETIATLLERKRAVIAAVTDGANHDEDAVVDALVRELAAEPFRPLRAVA
ncbi:MAG TPA: DEAD/DEAH box helicase [Solirubrobacteraceae bacterium]|nr:DEAD/DEAH box helicase [Solirubrobacteraceae bacterium]